MQQSVTTHQCQGRGGITSLLNHSSTRERVNLVFVDIMFVGVVTLCNIIGGYHCSGKVEDLCCSEALVSTKRPYTECHNPEDHNVNVQHHENNNLLCCTISKWKTAW